MSATIRLARQITQLGTESAFEVLARARQLEAAGRKVVHLELGEPDFPTPPHIVDAAIRAVRNGATRYAPAAGLPELREAIAESLVNRGVATGPERVVITSGAKPMLFYALVGLLETGDEALVPDPGFPIYESVVRFTGARAVGYSVDPARAGGIDVDEVASRISPRTRVLVLNSPHNPTGTVLEPSALEALAELARRHDLVVVSDEIYSRLVFEGQHVSIASLPEMAERTVIIDGFSKAYAMTGWRLGYGVMPLELARHVERAIINTTSCAPPFVQHAGLAALRGPQDSVREMLVELRARRDLLVAGLGRLDGCACAVPSGAFYAFPRVGNLARGLGLSVRGLADVLLEEFGLACLPGAAFGNGGAEHLRFSFATSREELGRALDALHLASSPGTRVRASFAVAAELGVAS